MKIAYVYDVIHPYVPGGVQRRIWELSRRLSLRGHEITIFGMKHWPGNDIVHDQGVRFWGVCPPQPLFSDGRRSIKEAVYFALKVLPPLMKERYDILDVASFPFFPCFPAALQSGIRRSKLVITWHEIWGTYWRQYLGAKGIFGEGVERLVSCLPHKAIAVSQSTKRDLAKLTSRDIEVIPSGVDISMIDTVQPHDQPADIVYVGRLTPEKNVALLIMAVNLIKKERANVFCRIIGDGPDKPRLQRLARDVGLEANVDFTGQLEKDAEVFSYMKSSKVLALPSLREGLGLVVIEANACGIPAVTVSYHQNAAQDLVKDGYNGFVSRLSEEDLAGKISAALDEGNDWAERCRRFAHGFDWNIIADAVEQFYEAAK
jgi:glycosyltransferase involved in cell wall biosynthesis